MIRHGLCALIAAATLLIAPLPPAFAQGAANAPPPAVDTPAPGPNRTGHQAMQACRADFVALCASVAAGGGRKIKCLKDNQAKLSAPCAAAIQAVLDRRGAAASVGQSSAGQGAKPGQPNRKQACQADIASVCPGVAPGKGGVAKCLKDNATLISQPCQAVVAERAAKHAQVKAVRATCAGDVVTLCGLVAKGPDVMACLREKQAQATPSCQQAIASLPAPLPHKVGGPADLVPVPVPR